MFDIQTLLTAVWFAIITLIIAEIVTRVPYPRIRILLPLVFGVLLGLFILIDNPLLESGYRGQTEYLGPFCFPVLVPLFISVPLIFVLRGEGIMKGKITEFSGAFLSSFLFLILYQSRIFFGIFQEFIASSFLFGSAFVISLVIFFIIKKGLPVFSGSRDGQEVNHDQQSAKKTPQADLKLMGLLAICLLVSLLPLYFIDLATNLDRSTRGQLSLSLYGPSEVPGGTVIHMTDEKLREYPELLTLIQKTPVKESGNSLHPEKKDSATTTSPGTVSISCKTESRMRDEGLFNGSSSYNYFEYDGDVYTFYILHYAGEECVQVSFFS